MELGVSGNFTVTLKNAYNYGTFGIGYVRFYYEEWYDIATNTSEIRIVDIKARQTKYTGSASVNIKAYVDGSDALVSKSMDAKLTSTSSYASVTGVEFPLVIKDADGNGLIKHDDITGEATTTLKFYAKLTVGEFTYNSTSSTTIALTKIPRISDLTVTGEEIGSSLQLNIAAATTDFTHTISYKFGAVSETIMDKSPSNIVFWTAPLSLCSEIPNDDKGECVFTISTYTGEELVGTKTVSVTLLVPDSVKLFVRPDCVTVDHYNTGTNASELAAYVQGYSKAQVSFDKDKIGYGTAYGATIGAFEIVHKGNTYSTTPNEEVTIEQILTAVLADAGEHTVECAVIDSRGKRVATTLTFLVESYTNPVIVTPKLFRCNAYGVETDDGTYLSVYAKASISSVAGLNQPTMIVTIGELTPEEVPVDQITVVGDANVQSTQTYRATITLTDSLGNKATYIQIIPTADVMFHGRAGGKGAAFGKYAEEDDLLEVAWNFLVKKNMTVEGDVTIGGKSFAQIVEECTDPLRFMPVGYIYVSADPTSPAQLFGGTWEQLKDTFILAAGDVYTADSTGGAASVTLMEENIPRIYGKLNVRTGGSSGYTNITVNDGTAFTFGDENGADWANGTSMTSTGHHCDTITLDFGGDADGNTVAHDNMPPYVTKYVWQRVEDEEEVTT